MLSNSDRFVVAATWCEMFGGIDWIETAGPPTMRWHDSVVRMPLVPCYADRDPATGEPRKKPRAEYKALKDGLSVQRFGDLMRLEHCAQRHGHSAWATVPALGGCVVVDVDDMTHLERLWSLYGPTPVQVITPGRGLHLWYRAPEGVRVRGQHFAAYDVKAAELCHLPGSAHPAPSTPALPYYTPAGDLVGGPLETFVARLGGLDLRDKLPPFRLDAFEAELAALPQRRRAASTPGVDDVELCADDEGWHLRGRDEFAWGSNRDAWRAYLAAAGPAVAGSGGHFKTRGVALKLGDLGCGEGDCLDLMREWNASNVPPWSDADLELRVRDAYRTRHYAVGCRLDEDEKPIADFYG